MGSKGLFAGLILLVGLVILLVGLNNNSYNKRMDPYQNIPESRLESRVEENPETLTEKLNELQTQTILPALDEGSRAVQEGDTVVVNYRGWLASTGEIFDQSFNRGEPFEFTVGTGVIEGWSDGVIGMKVGEVRRLKIPASLGYGSNDMGSIPADSDLIFDVEVLQITD